MNFFDGLSRLFFLFYFLVLFIFFVVQFASFFFVVVLLSCFIFLVVFLVVFATLAKNSFSECFCGTSLTVDEWLFDVLLMCCVLYF